MPGHAMIPSADGANASVATAPGPAAETATMPPVVHVAGFFRRLAAAIVDSLLLAPVLLGALWITQRIGGMQPGAGSDLRIETLLDLLLQGSPALFASIGLVVLLVLVYQFLFLATAGQTPGMRILRARLIDIYGDFPSPWRVALRGFGWLVALGVLGLGLLWIAFDREKRGLHDWLSGTYVVQCTPRALECR